MSAKRRPFCLGLNVLTHLPFGAVYTRCWTFMTIPHQAIILTNDDFTPITHPLTEWQNYHNWPVFIDKIALISYHL